MSGLPTPQRARTKTAELSDIFRGSHSSRHTTKDSRSVVPAVGVPNTPPEEKHKSRRSMLPFLGRRKAERPSASSSVLPNKSTGTPPGSFGKGPSLLTVASATDLSSSDRLPLPPLNISPPSLGSKFAAHLRSPTKTLKARYSSSQKYANTPTHPSTTLSPFSFDDHCPSLESRGSSIQSRSTTPRPLHQPPAENSLRYGVEEDFSDLFIRPEQTKSAPKASNISPIITKAVDSSKNSAELGPITPLTPASPTPPSTPRLQFPLPPSSYGLISPSSEKLSNRSEESSRQVNNTPSSKHSDSSLKLPAASPQRSSISHSRNHGIITDTRDRARTFSLSGSDTDASRATDSSISSRRLKHQSVLPRASALKRPASLQRAPSSSEKPSSGPPPSVPLPSPPPSVPSSIGSSTSLSPTIASVNRVPLPSSGHSTPRPRANTLSATQAVSSSKLAAWMSPKTTAQDKNMNSDIPLSASVDELRNALALQNRKYAQLQEYAVIITKKFEDEKASMTKAIQTLEREVRKKVREIEGLRWLVIHNGGAGDIDAAANLARASLVSLDDGDPVDSFRAMDTIHVQASQSATNLAGASSERDAGSATLSPRSHRGLGPDLLDHPDRSVTSLEPLSPEFGLSASSSRSSLSLTMLTPSTPLSVIPEQPLGKGEISRAERQRAKEERRAARALRRISLSSMSSATSGAPVASSLLPNDPRTFEPQHSMDNVLEKLRPFRTT